MAADVFKVVDSVAVSPTVRLDLNDGSTWVLEARSVDFSPPPLRRAINGTLLMDGSVQSASSYENRLLRFTLSVATGTTDATATQIQTLSRELDRESNYLMWQPSGATSPVFFRTLRTPATQIEAISPLNTSDAVHVEILAEPFALGLREDVAIGTVNNDPAAGSNGLFFDVSSVKGDVAAPIVLVDNLGGASTPTWEVVASRQRGTPSDLVFFTQAESVTLGTDTANPGGGPDAAMSGAGTNNYARTSFTSSVLAQRLLWNLGTQTLAQRTALVGTYRVLACVRRSDATSVINVNTVMTQGAATVTGASVVVPLSTSRQLVDLGQVTIGVTDRVGYGLTPPAITTLNLLLGIYAQRVSGTGTMDWDYITLVPADTQLLMWLVSAVGSTDIILDGVSERLLFDSAAGSSIFGGTIGLYDLNGSVTGGFPAVMPNQTNRFILMRSTASLSPLVLAHDKTMAGTVTVSYWPRYLYHRPAST